MDHVRKCTEGFLDSPCTTNHSQEEPNNPEPTSSAGTSNRDAAFAPHSTGSCPRLCGILTGSYEEKRFPASTTQAQLWNKLCAHPCMIQWCGTIVETTSSPSSVLFLWEPEQAESNLNTDPPPAEDSDGISGRPDSRLIHKSAFKRIAGRLTAPLKRQGRS
ncbi:hypothetical protein FQA47_019939 [Oryzias melastigma]|uniref:Uncharacterized protein n=1 Tax=Oryzias melastigma TaxID=30732 RepID=A0A834FJW6_ORYME|nr:hypothetical protein FQA47_019939 [Oryzias melastigma]